MRGCIDGYTNGGWKGDQFQEKPTWETENLRDERVFPISRSFAMDYKNGHAKIIDYSTEKAKHLEIKRVRRQNSDHIVNQSR